MLVVWLFVCLIEWNWVEFETFWKLNEREWNDFPNFPFALLDPNEFNSIPKQNPRVKVTWLLPLEMERVWKDLNFTWKYFKLKALCNSMIFMREDKMTSSIIWNMSWKLKKNQIESHLKLPCKFGIIWILFKLFFS